MAHKIHEDSDVCELVKYLRRQSKGKRNEELRAALGWDPDTGRSALSKARRANLVRVEGERRSALYFAVKA